MPRSALVVDGGSAAALAATRSLGRAGWRVTVPGGSRSAQSRYAAARAPVPDPAERPGEFVAAVAAAAAAERFDVVVPSTDASAELLRANEELLRGAQILGGDRPSFELTRDKAATLAAAEAAGFGTPRWRAPASREEAHEAMAEIGLPLVVKPRRSYTVDGDRLLHRRHVFVRSEAGLDRALEAQAMEDGALPLVEEYVPGRAILVSAVVRGGSVLAGAAWETLSFDPVIGGTSVWKRTVAPEDAGVEEAFALLVAVGYEGLGAVEYQVAADGRFCLMEIGMRLHASVSLDLAAGVDLPLVAASALLGDDVSGAPAWRPGVEMRWPAGEIARVRAALRRDLMLPPGMSRAAVLAKAWPPWRPGMRYDGLARDDPGPWLPRPLRRALGRDAAT